MKKIAVDIIKEIKKELRKTGNPCSNRDKRFVLKYLGTEKKYFNVKAADRDKILGQFAKKMKNLSVDQTLVVLDELLLSDTYDYINFAGKFLVKFHEVRENVSFKQIEKWLRKTQGWAECDSICQSLMSEKEVLERWSEWQKAINKFSTDKNIQLRRASLVLQTKPARESKDPKLRKLGFEKINKLQGEKDILITKAISWLLRDLSWQNKEEVLQYLKDNQESLPKIAFRETMKKITTGKK